MRDGFELPFYLGSSVEVSGLTFELLELPFSLGDFIASFEVFLVSIAE